MANLDFSASQINTMLQNEDDQDAKISALESQQFKTINGESIKGSGNITIGEGSGSTPVVDSLDSDSTTSALSAKQGKVLNDKVVEIATTTITNKTPSAIEDSIGSNSTATFGSTITFDGAVNRVVFYANYAKNNAFIYICQKSGSTLTIVKKYAVGNVVAGNRYDIDLGENLILSGEYIVCCDFRCTYRQGMAGYTLYVVPISAEKNVGDTLTSTSQLDGYAYVLYFYKSELKPKGLTELEAEIDEVRDSVQLADYDGTEQLAVADNIVENRYINTNGVIASQNTWKMLLIEVDASTAYSVKASNYNATYALYLLDANKVAIKGYGASNSIGEAWGSDNVQGYRKVETTANTKYICCNCKVYEEVTWSIFKGEGIYKEKKVSGLNGISLDNNILAMHRVVCLGDSITALGGDKCNGANGWTTYFNEFGKPSEIRSYARSGATWSHTANTTEDIVSASGQVTDNNVIYNQICRLINDVDNNGKSTPSVIIIGAGTNDAWYPILRPNALDVTDGLFDGDAYYSADINSLTSVDKAIRYGIEKLKVKFPYAQIVLMTPPQSAAFALKKCHDVGDIIEDCASNLSVSCIRLDKVSCIYRIQEKNGYVNTQDGTHPNALGAKRNGHIIAQKVKAMLCDEII